MSFLIKIKLKILLLSASVLCYFPVIFKMQAIKALQYIYVIIDKKVYKCQ